MRYYINTFNITFVFLMVLIIPQRVCAQNELVEKVYTQTDRPFYFPGETIWFKSYITVPDHTVTSISDVLHAELISPKGAVVKNLDLAITQGYAYGDFSLLNDWIGGVYTLKMYTNWMKNYEEEAFFTKKITVQKIVKPNLLLQLKFEKEAYGKGARVVANFEAKDLKNQALENTEITYKVAVQGNTIIEEKALTNTQGKAAVTFKLPEDLQTRDVVLNLMIPHKGSTEALSRSVPVLLDNLDLQFFAESGNLVVGTTNKVAFKSVNEFGKPADVTGKIVDNSGSVITTFNSYHDGMGSFELTPETGKRYSAMITAPFISEEPIPLPIIQEKGTKFSVSTIEKGTVALEVFSSIAADFRLEIIDANAKLSAKNIQLEAKNNWFRFFENESFFEKKLTINTDDFPRGITKFTLYDGSNSPVAERLVFVNKDRELQVAVCLDKETYQTREKVKVTIKTKDVNGKALPSNLSVSVADNKLLSFADDKQDHILSSLLLSSELKGKIHKPIFYFDKEEPKASKALDYVLLTHGWRTFIEYPSITLENAKHKPEHRAICSGKVVDKNGNPSFAKLILFERYGTDVLVFETDEKGAFSFKTDEQKSYVLLAYREDKKKLNIIADFRNNNKQRSIAYDTTRGIMEDTRQKEAFVENKKPLQKSIKRKAVASVSLKVDDAELDEVVVVGYGTSERKSMSGASTTIIAEHISSIPALSMEQALQGRVAGVSIAGDSYSSGVPGASTKIVIRGSNSLSGNNTPLVVVDGVIMNYATIASIDPNAIANVEVLKDEASSAIYGCRGASGVIIIKTKNNNEYGWKSLNNRRFNNYATHAFYRNYKATRTYKGRQFYQPIYDSKELPEERTDFRNTIYWNPVVQTDENGEAVLEFYNSDAITSFKIITEGIGYNGLLGRDETLYSTKKMLNVTFKAPSYLALNDVVELPVTITNESNELLDGDLEIDLPKDLKFLSPMDSKIVIQPHSYVVKNIRVIPIAKAENTVITATVKTNKYTDVFKKQITVLSPYFPIEASVSGSTNKSFSLFVENPIENSLTATFNVYTDIVGNVMDGIGSLIRQPYGCFEQVSSATYPNVLVLKYLKEIGKNDPEIEKKALSFIKKGYKKLAAYETKENGFEWYGKTPPHEALSVYGLMEFKEMKEVYEGVDPKMIQRTIDWLLSRRDGQGGFKQNKGKYGFSAAPKNVNNAYIVYAISEAGIAGRIENEYNYTYNESLKSNDSYRMALMALASHNFGRSEATKKTLSKIKQNILDYSFEALPVTHTITRSWGKAKNMETVAFTLLALMKETEPDESLIVKGVRYLIDQRRSGRFGNTQSTSMVLKVLIEYTRMFKQKVIKGNTVKLIVNGQTFNQSLEKPLDGKIMIHGITPYFKEGKQDIKVVFEDSKNTFPYELQLHWDSRLPASSAVSNVKMKTTINTTTYYKVGDNMRMEVAVINQQNQPQPMTTAIIGIPSGAAAQPWQLKEILEEEKVAYYEIFDNYLVFYWRELGPSETKIINLDLKAEVSGNYKAPASTVYLYYGDEEKYWLEGEEVVILP